MIAFSVLDGRITAAVLASSPWKYPPKSTAGPWASASSDRIAVSLAASAAAIGAKCADSSASSSCAASASAQ